MTDPTTRPPAPAVLASRPVLPVSTARVWIDRDLVCWPPERVPTAVDRFVAAVIPHLDGVATVAELAEDLAAAVGESQVEVQAHVASGMLHLARRGAVEGIDRALWVPRPEEPGPVQAEELPDGRTRYSVTLEFSTDNADDRAVIEGLLSGELSQLDAVPGDSCVGQRLRLGSEVDRFCTRIGDRTVAVRCDHEPTSAVLDRRMRRADGGGGTTVAVVTGPFEGDGPPRVYDASARRVGRPRDGDSAAEVVGYLLNELLPAPEVGPPAASVTLAIRDERAVLLPAGLADLPFLAGRLDQRGVRVVPTRRVVLQEGEVTVEAALGRAPEAFLADCLLVPDVADGLSPRTRAVLLLLDDPVVKAVRSRQSALDRVTAWVEGGSTTLRPLPEDAAALVDAVVALLASR